MNTLWLDLLNSDWHDYKGGGMDEDRLENRQWLRRFLNKWEALQIEPDYPSIIKELKALRTLIRKMADDFRSEKGIRKADLNSFNTILENSPMVSRIEASPRDIQSAGTASIQDRDPCSPISLPLLRKFSSRANLKG